MLNLHKVLRWLGLVFVLTFVFLVLFSVTKRGIYLSGQGINVLMISKEGMGIIAIRPSRELVEVTKLPDNLTIRTDSSGANYLVEAIYKIGLPVKNDLEMARVIVGQDLGVVLGGVVKTNSELSAMGLREAFLSLSVRTNLGFFDRYKAVKDLTNILGKGSSITSSIPSNVLDEKEEPDGKKVLSLNQAIFVWSRNRWVVDEVLSETGELTVVNGSGIDGKARVVARQLETAGGRVIDVLVSKKEVGEKCILIGKPGAHLQTAAFITASFGCRNDPLGDPNEYIDTNVRSDLVMVVGRGS